jgi:mediator of RNA polymerase II transcription subunit 5
MDVDILGPTCKLLHTYDHALEIVALHTRICDLIFTSLLFLEEYDCEIVGEFFLCFLFYPLFGIRNAHHLQVIPRRR